MQSVTTSLRADPPLARSRDGFLSLPHPGRAIWYGLAMAAVVLLAGALRFSGIRDVGIRFDDEGAYAHDARLWYRSAVFLTDSETIRAVGNRDKSGLKVLFERAGIDFGARYAKPCQGYTFLAALAMFVAGDDPVALMVVNALCGTLTVWLVYALGSLLVGRSCGLIAALLLAVSPYHLAYCRSAWAVSSATMFIVLGVWWWARGRSRLRFTGWNYLLAGLSVGYATACHYSSAFVLGVIVVVDVWARASRDLEPLHHEYRQDGIVKSSRNPAMRRWMCLSIGFAVPILAIEAVFQAARYAAVKAEVELPLRTLVESAADWSRVVEACGVQPVGGGVIDWSIPKALTGYVIHWQGNLAAAAMGIGVLLVLGRRAPVVVCAAIPLALIGLLSLQRYSIDRALAPAIPFLCLCGAVAVVPLTGWLRKTPAIRSAVVVMLVGVIAAPVAGQIKALIEPTNDIARACRFVARSGDTVVVPLDSAACSKYALYLDGTGVRVVHEKLYRLGTPGEVIARLRQKGADWIITDPQVWHYRNLRQRPDDEVFRWWQEFEWTLARRAVLAAEFPHVSESRWQFLAEGPGTDLLSEMEELRAGSIRVFALSRSPEAIAQAVEVNRPQQQPHP